MSIPNHIVHTLTQYLPLAQPSHIEIIQPLWNDYGYCVRCRLRSGRYVVVKVVALPTTLTHHPKGWTTKRSHARKCRSFEVEMNFYQHYALHTPLPQLPKPFTLKTLENGWLFALSDLKAEGFINTCTQITVAQSFGVLDWLAHFHGSFLHHSGEGLWPQGGYWHLSTRQDELKQTQSDPLKSAAGKLDELLATCPYQTIIHGDAKVANFCFTADFQQCAAVDFQYPGRAPGIVDVAYFIGSALTDKDQVVYWETCLDRYFSTLAQALSANFDEHQIKQIESAWRALYPIACADFHRFLSGWSPEHWKINQHLHEQTAFALAMLDQNQF
ncbi:ecdysteroid 22-kinase family protein [Alteromonas ponticola]|uniref:Ecdysteroid 22-kinase family protein n=1 Tax=Alteromonas aquimaris TaxID=2998417 RepID=A0ABT3P7H1_9ALTE|nr:oxidoreductase family protein [Alteromonas aquimaris]MCW8108714.1 ecdysteroid 22-kinase family protein [Alteromonas aquimaris]